MKFVLDELVDAFHHLRGSPLPREIIPSTELSDQFSRPITPKLWCELGTQLGCILPPLQRLPKDRWWFPSHCHTIYQLCKLVRRQHPAWVLPSYLQEMGWPEVQIFAVVRTVLVEALCVYPEEVVPTARLQADLCAE
jgi:hypothetical protein